MDKLFKILVLCILFSPGAIMDSYGQNNRLMEVIDSLSLNAKCDNMDSIMNDSINAPPLIIIDGIPIKKSQLNNFKMEDIRSFNVLPDTVAMQMFDNGKYGIIILRTNLSKRKLKKKL